jgi:hypothetical protein
VGDGGAAARAELADYVGKLVSELFVLARLNHIPVVAFLLAMTAEAADEAKAEALAGEMTKALAPGRSRIDREMRRREKLGRIERRRSSHRRS